MTSMDTSVTGVIERIVKDSGSWEEARQRVVNSLGEHSVFEAECVALQVHGISWLRESETWRKANPDAPSLRGDQETAMSKWGMRDGRKFGAAAPASEEASQGQRSQSQEASLRQQVDTELSFSDESVLRVQLIGDRQPAEANLNPSQIQLNVPPLGLRIEFPSNAASGLRSRLAAATLGLLVMATLFPPFYLPVSQGLQTNMGFGFLFSPPSTGSLVALVNVPLLFAEYLAITLCAGLSMVWGPAFLSRQDGEASSTSHD